MIEAKTQAGETVDDIPPAIRHRVATETLDQIETLVKKRIADQQNAPAVGSNDWRDKNHAAADYLDAFGLEPTDRQVASITARIGEPQYWKQALALWKTVSNDPADLDGLLHSYWLLHLEGKVTIDAVRLLHLNRAVASLPDLYRGWRIVEDYQTEEGRRTINDAKGLIFLLGVHHHEAWSGEAGTALDAVFLCCVSPEWQLQTLGTMLLCETLQKYPAILTGAVEHMHQALLT